MGQDTTLQIVMKFALHIGGQAFGLGVGGKGGQKGLQVVDNAGTTGSRSAAHVRGCNIQRLTAG
jgi:hypothetical protein